MIHFHCRNNLGDKTGHLVGAEQPQQVNTLILEFCGQRGVKAYAGTEGPLRGDDGRDRDLSNLPAA
jgi:hypothetical protein